MLMIALLCNASNINGVQKAHYSFIKNFVKTEIDSERALIKNLNSLINLKKANKTGIFKTIQNDELSLLRIQLENEKNMRSALKQTKKDIDNCLKEDLVNLNKPAMRKLLEKEIVRQADRDTAAQLQLEGIKGDNQQQQRIHMYTILLEKELSFMRGIVTGCKTKVCNSLKDIYDARKGLVQKQYRKYVKMAMKSIDRLIEAMQEVKSRYLENLGSTKPEERVALRKRINELEQLIAGYEKQKIGVRLIHATVIEEFEQLEADRQRRALTKFLDATDNLEKSKISIQQKEEQLKSILKLLGRKRFVPKRYKLVRRKRQLLKVLKALKNYRRKLVVPTFIRNVSKFEKIQKSSLKKVVHKIAKLNRHLRSLDRAEKHRIAEVKELEELKKYDTTLSSINQLKQKEVERKRDAQRREQIMKEIEENEHLKSVIVLSLGARKREFAMKKIFKALEIIAARITDAKNRGIEARNKLEAMKYAERRLCSVKNMEIYQNMLKRAQKDRIILIKKRNAYVTLNKRIIKEQEKYLEALLKHLREELKKAEERRKILSKEALYANDNSKSAKLEGVERAIESLDKSILKTESRKERLAKLVGHLRVQKASVFCKKSWKCNTCEELAEIAKIGLIKHRGDGWTMQRATKYCNTFKGAKKEMCFREAFDVFSAATHIIDPFKYDSKAICQRFNHC